MIAAGVTPDYPRPAPPPGARRRLARAIPLLAGATAYLLPWGLATALRAGAPDNERARLLGIAFFGGDAWELTELARARFGRGEYEDAARLYAAASIHDESDACAPANMALSFAWAARCGDAEAAMRVANQRLSPRASTFDRNCVRSAGETTRLCSSRALFPARR
jgi:hypothetical protein